MSKMIEVNTADLIGPALDLSTGLALGWVRYPEDSIECGTIWHMGGDRAPFGPVIRTTDWCPSANWVQGGPLLAKYFRLIAGMVPSLDMWPDEPADLLPWVMRKIVEFELGDVVSVPVELMQGGEA